jgi:hypothetical protein
MANVPRDAPKKSDTRVQNFAYVVGVGILSHFFVTVLLVHLTFLVGGSADSWQFPVGFLISTGLVMHSARAKQISPLWATLAFGASIIGCSLGALFWQDISYDGQWYRSESILALRAGWNPVFYPGAVSKYAAMYPRAVETYGSVAWMSLGTSMEIGKLSLWTTALASFLLSFAGLAKICRLSTWWQALIALTAALNPVTVAQLRTTMVDGATGSLILVLIAAVALSRDEDKILSRTALVAAVFLLGDAKTYGFLVALLVGILLVIPWHRFLPKSVAVTSQSQAGLVVLGATIVSAVLIWNPYVTHSIRYHNPIYPILSDEFKVVMADQAPADFQTMSNLGKLVRSEFSRPQNSKLPTRTIPFPWLARKSDLKAYEGPDTRIKGFGPFTLPLAVVALVAFGCMARRDRARCWLIGGISALILIGVYGSGVGWWARFAPQLWLVPLMIAVALDEPWAKWFRVALVGIAWINIAIVGLVGFRHNYKVQRELATRINVLKRLGSPVYLVFTKDPMPGYVHRLQSSGLVVHVIGLKELARRIQIPLDKMQPDAANSVVKSLPNCEPAIGAFGSYQLVGYTPETL